MDELLNFSYFSSTNGRKTQVLRWASAHLKMDAAGYKNKLESGRIRYDEDKVRKS